MIVENKKLPQLRGTKIGWRMCYENNIATYAFNNKINYEMMFLNALRVEYEKEESLKTCWNNIIFRSNKRENLLTYNGIVQEVYNGSIKEIKNACSNNKMCMTVMDSYYCPWDKYYGKEHREEHYFLIYDYNGSEFLCTDPTYECTGMALKEDILENTYVTHIELSHRVINKTFDYVSLIQQEAAYILDNGILESLGSFTYSFSEDFINACRDDIVYVKYIFENIEKNIVQFCVLLKYVASENKNYNEFLNNIVRQLLSVSNIWRIMQLDLINYKNIETATNKIKSMNYIGYIKKAISTEIEILQLLRKI